MSSSSNTLSPIKVGIVDDSPLIRQLISAAIEESPEFQVVGSAADPFEAREMIKRTNPDVITLDIEMPRMNGIEFLDKIMKLRPMPVIMVSTLTHKGADITLQALEMGALDYVPKPETSSGKDNILNTFRTVLIPKLKAVRSSNTAAMGHIQSHKPANINAPTKTNHNYDIIGIASSTGGIERLRYLISNISVNLPPVVIIQHINKLYVPRMIERMQEIAPPHINIKLTRHNDKLQPNTIYFPDNITHLTVKKAGSSYRAHLIDKPPLNGFIASADYLFNSLAEESKNDKVLGLIISGMGNDGAEGLLKLKNAGGNTVGENEASCLVYGMPKAAAAIGALNAEKTIQNISKLMNDA